MKRAPFTAAASLSLALLASSALAQPVAQAPNAKIDLAMFHGTPDTIIHVIRHIEAVSGGHVIEVRFTPGAEGAGWDAAVDQGGRIDFVRLQSEDGQPVALTENSRPTWSLHWAGRNDVQSARTAKVSLVDAIRSAERADHEPAVAAGIATLVSNHDRGVTAYNVLLADRDGPVRRAVDADTGLVIADPSALGGWP